MRWCTVDSSTLTFSATQREATTHGKIGSGFTTGGPINPCTPANIEVSVEFGRLQYSVATKCDVKRR